MKKNCITKVYLSNEISLLSKKISAQKEQRTIFQVFRSASCVGPLILFLRLIKKVSRQMHKTIFFGLLTKIFH